MIGHRSEIRRIMKDSELHEIFRRTRDFKTSIDDSFYYSKQFYRYIFTTFISTGNINTFVYRIVRCINKSSSDYNVYRLIRQELTKKGITVQNLIRREIINYPRFIKKKIRSLSRIIHKLNIDMNNIKFLDVGTESLDFLDEIQLRFNIINNDISGINIDKGFCHYDIDEFESNKYDNRFNIYDGKHINSPDNYYQFITMFSVIHHIDTTDLKCVVKELARVCANGGYVFIKDVDLCYLYAQHLFRIQHYLYTDGVLTPGSGSCINDTVTKDNTLSVFENEGFKVLYIENVNNFNSSYYCVLYKNY